MPEIVYIQFAISIPIHGNDVFIIVIGKHPRETAPQYAISKRFMILMQEMIQV